MKVKLFALPSQSFDENQISGAGEKNILVIIKAAEASDKTVSDLLNAIKLDQDKDIIKLTVGNNGAMSIASLLSEYGIKKILSFGLSADEMGFNINQAYNYIYSFTAYKLLMSESIAELKTDKNKKIALWKSLQELFLD